MIFSSGESYSSHIECPLSTKAIGSVYFHPVYPEEEAK
jgi:hypothetical protein